MQVGDLVCSKWDVSKGHYEPLGMITKIEDWMRMGKIYKSVYVLLFKSRTVDNFSVERLIKFEDINYEKR